MKASLIIPVWNGATVIGDCLQAVFAQQDDDLFEVICVDNASIDESAAIIGSTYPHVHLLSQPVNLGFAGGVNAGMQAAQGDIFVLLNQDCIPEKGWMASLDKAQAQHPQVGIFGCTILNTDGTLNHTGAVLHHPEAVGQHLQYADHGQVKPVDFVTGAAIAIRRSTWDKIGAFDEGYYPAYYEDCDFCYRARRQGIETAWVSDSQVRHSFSSREWQVDPIKHTTNGYLSRYRFVSKHFSSQEFSDFIHSERQSLDTVSYLDHAVGRVIAAKHTLGHLDEILERRRLDLGEQPSIILRRQLQVGFAEIARSAFQRARNLIASSNALITNKIDQHGDEQGALAPANQLNMQKSGSILSQRLQELKQTESDILATSVFRTSTDFKGAPFYSGLLFSLKRFIARLTSGGEFNRIYHLNLLHARQILLIEEEMTRIANFENEIDQIVVHSRQLEEAQKLLEILTEYEYR